MKKFSTLSIAELRELEDQLQYKSREYLLELCRVNGIEYKETNRKNKLIENIKTSIQGSLNFRVFSECSILGR